jgi:hypothetical protein
VKAKIPAHRAEQAEISHVQHLFTRTDEEGEGDVDFLDDLHQGIPIQRDAGIQDTVTGEDSNDESVDKEDEG